MHGRRRETRFLPSAPWNAALQTVEDVALERTEGGDVCVVCDIPARRGDVFVLEVATGGLRIDVRVDDSEPALVDGIVRHRLRLRVLDPETIGFPEPLSVREAPARAGERHGTKHRSRY
jgi:hypothetical protein